MEIIFLIVTFEPDQNDFLVHLRRNLQSASKIIIVDNSYTEESISFVKSLGYDKVIIIQNFDNLGIAEAQNIGILKFLELNADYLLQLDQDSSITESSLRILFEYYERNSVNLNLAGVAPCASTSTAKSVKQVKSAGLLIHRNVINRVGMMQPDLFMDLVDYEWCWRAIKLNFKLHVVPCEFFHQLGTNYRVFGFVSMSIPDPIRHYYQVRNSLRLIFSFKAPFAWSLFRIIIIITKLLVYPVIIPNGKLRLVYMLYGMTHFTLGKVGKFQG